jgi:hypothetical protein
MGADFSRVRFNPLNDFAGVDMQQGRVLLDGDFNELVDVIDRRFRAACADLGSPGVTIDAAGTVTDTTAVVPRTTPDGFNITPLPLQGIAIGVGRMYVDGIVVENHGRARAVFDPVLGESVQNGPTGDGINVTYNNQPYWPTPDPLPPTSQSGNYLVYLDVWQREVTPLQDPHLIEQAVGVDTTIRTQNVWQVRVLPVGPSTTCTTPDPAWSALIAPSAARLSSAPVPVEPSTDPCQLPPTGGYRGLENQLYRVEIHAAGKSGASGPLGTATLKWSRDNASVTSAVTAIDPSGSTVTVASLGKDDVLRISDGDWVEINDDNREFNQLSGEIRKVTVEVATKTLTLSAPLPTDLIPTNPDTPATRHTRVIRWDQSGNVTALKPDGTSTVIDLDTVNPPGLIPIPTDGSQIVLENGIAVSFKATPTGGNVRAGDYWVFAARTADTSIEQLDQAPPRRIHHHYARLALVNVEAGSAPQFNDCRQPWPPVCGCECTICLTPSSSTTLQDAVTQLQTTGGTICLTAGVYQLTQPVLMNGCQSVRIRGQGTTTILMAPSGAFTVTSCIDCTIENLAIVSGATDPTVVAVALTATLGTTLQQMAILALGTSSQNQNTGAAIGSTAVTLDGVQAALIIRENLIIGSVGITEPPPGTTVGGLLAIAPRIESNTLWCSEFAIGLAGIAGQNGYLVAFAFGAEFNDNCIVTREFGSIVVGGPMVGGGVLRIDGNDIQVSGGFAILTSPSNCVVAGNTISAPPAPGTATKVGIVLFSDSVFSQAGSAAIDNNTVTGMLGGIVIGAANAEVSADLLEIGHNTIQNCGNGIAALATGDITISANRLLDLSFTFPSPTEGQPKPQPVVGISTSGGNCTSVVDNTIDGISATNGDVQAIVAKAATVLLSGNVISNISTTSNPPGTNTTAIGIVVVPLASADVSHNQVRPGANASGAFAALDIGGTRNTPPPTASITDNTFYGAGRSSQVVLVQNLQDLQFSSNTVEAGSGSTATAVSLGTELPNATVRCQGNLVRGGSISILGGKPKVAVLGNMTTNDITVNSGGIQPPWSELNVTGI